ncbi:MAG: hypothetical protein Q9P90_15080 [candidate division KSB1 bacterium]|nr:hypothetical protein [candidate division KSB1 bacterium]
MSEWSIAAFALRGSNPHHPIYVANIIQRDPSNESARFAHTLPKPLQDAFNLSRQHPWHYLPLFAFCACHVFTGGIILNGHLATE